MPILTLHTNDLMPAVNFASRDIAIAGTSWGRRIIPDWQLFYVVAGRAELITEEGSHTIREGECVLYGPDSPTRLTILQQTDYYSIHFHWSHPSAQPLHPGLAIRYPQPGEAVPASLALSLNDGAAGSAAVPPLLSVAGLEPLLTRMVKEYELEQAGYALTLRALMLQTAALIFRQMAEGRRAAAPGARIEAAVQAMQERPGHNWAVAELAALCGYHPIHFSKLFKEELGMTPKQYIIGERIKLAKQALLKGEKMESISVRLGFTSIHYFSHQFKRVTGLTPSEFRMSGRTDNA